MTTSSQAEFVEAVSSRMTVAFVSQDEGASQNAVPRLVSITDPRAADARLTGAKAARLADAYAAGLPVLRGFVLTTDFGGGAGPLVDSARADLRSAWEELSNYGERPLVVRSSSTAEDGSESSMAGLFTSVVGVSGWPDFLDAVERVLASGREPRAAVGNEGSVRMAVLVQQYLDASVGGVLFGADPVSGRADRVVLAAATGGPHRLVDGTAEGAHYTLTRRGREVAAARREQGPLSAGQRRSLARLAARAADVFGRPQDIEWAHDRHGELYLLQSRPITATADPVPRRGALLGPGPVAETFPDPLELLEEDLWVAPLREGLANALDLAGVASARRLRRSPVVTAVAGRVAADLKLLGAVPGPRPRLAMLDPRPGARRLRAAWRVGRLRAALPVLTDRLLVQLDAELASIPSLETCDEEGLLTLLAWSRLVLAALHAHEALAGMIAAQDRHPGDEHRLTAAAIALRVLADAAEAGAGASDGRARSGEPAAQEAAAQEPAAQEPVLLTLVPPAVRRTTPVPVPAAPPANTTARRRLPAGAAAGELRPTVTDLAAREGARLRIRWVHELGARAAWEAGRRLASAGVIGTEEAVRALSLDELAEALRHRTLPGDVDRRPARLHAAPLPAAFRLTAAGRPVAIEPRRRRRRVDAAGNPAAAGRPNRTGEPAGGGRGAGTVRRADHRLEPGSVLVVANLDPALAIHLPGLAGLVAETGSPLSHLAILARELSVPTVVGVPEALTRFPVGSRVLVDGAAGQVSRLDTDDTDAAEAAA